MHSLDLAAAVTLLAERSNELQLVAEQNPHFLIRGVANVKDRAIRRQSEVPDRPAVGGRVAGDERLPSRRCRPFGRLESGNSLGRIRTKGRRSKNAGSARSGGRTGGMVVSYPAYANKHIIVRNDNEIVRYSLAKE